MAASAVKQFHYAWEWRLAATPSALWPFVSDTNRFNRDAGVPSVEETAGSTTGARRLRLRKYGVLIEWQEEPFEWVKPRSFGVVRKYARGPVAEMHIRTELIPDGAAHTIIRYDVTAIPRNLVGRLAIPLQVGIISRYRFASVFRRYAEAARKTPEAQATYYALHRIELLPRAAKLPPGGDTRIERIRAELAQKFAPQLIDQLLAVVVRGDDLTVVRLRPHVLADLWRAPRRTVVNLFLHATRAGLLELQWDVLCPFCRGPKQINTSLNGIAQPVHCAACNIDFNANFEQSVELTFSPSSAIRVVEVFPFCVGGPQVTPHIVLQQQLHAGETRTIQTQLERGRYRVRTPGIGGGQLFRVDDHGSDRIELTARAAGWADEEKTVLSNAQCVLSNQTDSARLVIVERLAWTDQALTASEVIALQEFRDLFASEALRPGEAISVGSVAILFTDLRDSTRMYRQIGDAPAFGRVMNHFDVLRAAMQEEEGALVKTIGDAIMAVFRRPAGAIRAVLRAQQLLAELPEGVQSPNLKAGIHFGPCIAVTLNDRLDYFGSTVNIAARLGACSAGGEIIISEAVAQDPEVQALLQQPDLTTTAFETRVKGYDDAPLQLFRLSACD